MIRRQPVHLFPGLCAVVLVASTAAATDAPSPADLQFFENKVRPVLAERCYACHSTKEGKDKGGLHVDGRAALLKGGDNGPSLVPGKPAKSKLIEAISYKNVDLQMPPKSRLTDAQVADLTEWVRRGAPWPAEQGGGSGGAAAKAGEFDLTRRKAEHWAWQPVSGRSGTVPPAVKDAAGWAKTDVDRFLLAKLEEKNLTPAGPADKRTLIRRAALVLTGLPPTPAEVEAFVADGSPGAFETVVDRLLASPAFGERWGRHWLDLVRYAETRGHEFDYDIPGAYQYRDYVIRAFNADVPYDRFVTEHVAGDLLPDPRRDATGTINESVLGTGFWFLNEQVHSPVDIRQDECDRVDNQIDVFAKTFLGLTVGCARCHDHKFDAIGAKDYYALAGFLHSSSYRDARFEHEAHNRKVADRLAAFERDAGKRVWAALSDATKPTRERLDDYLLAAGKVLRGEQPADVRGDLDADVLNAWVAELRRAERDPDHPLELLARTAKTDNLRTAHAAAFRAADAARVAKPGKVAAAADGAQTWKWSRVVDYADFVSFQPVPPPPWITNGHGFGARPLPGRTVLAGRSPAEPIAAVLDGGTAHSAACGPGLPGLLRTPTFVISAPTLSMLVAGTGQAFVCIDSHRVVEGPLHGVSKQQIKTGGDWKVKTVDLSGYVGQRAHVEFKPADDGASPLAVRWVNLDGGPVWENVPGGHFSGIMSLWLHVDGANPSYAGVARRHADEFRRAWAPVADNNVGATGGELDVADWMTRRLSLFGYTPAAREKVAGVLAEVAAARKAIRAEYKPSAAAPAMLDGTPFDERVLIRGSHKTPGEVVPRRFLEAVDGPEPLAPGNGHAAGSGRLALARRVVDPANPLTGRVMVNRVWHHLFGRGIVASTDDFGVLGERPTHPELLDHLAAEFVKDGWSTKRLIRRLVLTRAWQMSSRPTADGDRVDPRNLLLHRATLRRLEAEAIRDQMLAVSGRLDGTMFGPSAKVHLTGFMEGRGRPKESGPLDGGGRRSVYLEVRRNFLSPMMLAFDAPQPFNTMGRRAASNVPAQALILMNDPFVVQQAGLWARRVLEDRSLATPELRIDQMYRSAFARPPTGVELSEATRFVEAQRATLGVGGDDPRVWADLAHVLMNVKEFIYVP